VTSRSSLDDVIGICEKISSANLHVFFNGLDQGWANIFYRGSHWRFYCYRGPHARITYITSIIALKTVKKYDMSYHKRKVTIATSGW